MISPSLLFAIHDREFWDGPLNFYLICLQQKESGEEQKRKELLLGVCLFSSQANKAAISIGMREGGIQADALQWVSGPHTLFLSLS